MSMPTDDDLDITIYQIDAVMNDYEPGTEVPGFLPVPTEKMREILRKLIERDRSARNAK